MASTSFYPHLNSDDNFIGEDFSDFSKINLFTKKYMAFKGGGGKGNAYLGVIEVIEQEKYGKVLSLRPENSSSIIGVSGASAGAITALTISLGLNSQDIRAISSTKTSEFLFEGGFEFAHFMTKDEPNPGSYRAVQIMEKEGEFHTLIGYTCDRIYKDDFYDLQAKKNKKNLKSIKEKNLEIEDSLNDFLKEQIGEFNPTNTNWEKYQMKKLAALKIKVAGGKVTEEPRHDPVLREINLKSQYKLIPRTLIGYLRGSLFMEESLGSPIARRLATSEQDFYDYMYNILFDRGLFCGTYVRKYYERLIDYYLSEYHNTKYELYNLTHPHIRKGTINLLDFFSITGIDLRVGGTNLTAGENVIFSRIHTPYFPVCEAVGLSMNIPGVFKPVYIKSKDKNGKELEGTNLKSGLYVDSGLTNNMPMATFFEHSPNLSESGEKIKPENVLGFRVFDGPNPKIFDPLKPYIWDDEVHFKPIPRVLYGKYIREYAKKHGELPSRMTPITYYDIPAAPRGFLGMTLLKMLGYSLDCVLNNATNNDLTEQLEKNIVDVYSYNITTMDFTPDPNLLKFVVGQAEIRCVNLLKNSSVKKE